MTVAAMQIAEKKVREMQAVTRRALRETSRYRIPAAEQDFRAEQGIVHKGSALVIARPAFA